jgi:3-keto-disaccharide hydrolase
MKIASLAIGVAVGTLAVFALPATLQPDGPQEPVGYSDTPYLPGGKWRVHDIERPAPPVVTPGVGAAPPSDATVLFDGKDLAQWKSGDKDAGWKLVDGAMEVNGTGTIQTRQEFGDLQLHLEWMAPSQVESSSQGRGNSGVFLMGRYEVQVLDSFENRTYSDGQAASLYGQRPPEVNASRKPGEWQSYDILWRAPRFEGETLASPGIVTVLHNGVAVHHAQAFLGATAHRSVAKYSPHPRVGPIALQDHGNPVRYRNIWVRPLE